MSLTPPRHSGRGRLNVGGGTHRWRMVAVASTIVAAGFVFTTSVPTAGAVGPPPGAIVVGLVGPECPAPTPPPIQPVIDSRPPDPRSTSAPACTTSNSRSTSRSRCSAHSTASTPGRVGPTQRAETVFDVPAGAIVYTTGATTGTLDGFTLRNADGAAVNGVNNVEAQAYTFRNNIITANTTGMNFHYGRPRDHSLISRNRFVANNKLPGERNSGSSIFITNGDRRRNDRSRTTCSRETSAAPTAADINTPGCGRRDAETPGSRSGTTRASTTPRSPCSTTPAGTQVLNNTITHSDPDGGERHGDPPVLHQHRCRDLRQHDQRWDG